MANDEHVEIFMQGRAVWNQWRKDHPDIRPDLSGFFLGKFDLSGADLSDAWLSDTKKEAPEAQA